MKDQQRILIFAILLVTSIVCSVYLVAYQIIPLYVIVAVMILFSYAYYAILYIRPFEQKLYTPSNAALIFLTVYSIAGILVYYAREVHWFNYPGDIEIASFAALLAIWSVFLGLWVSKIRFFQKRETGPESAVRRFQPWKLRRLILVYIVAGNLASFVLFDYYSSVNAIPLFSDDTTLARTAVTQYSPGRGTLWSAMYLLMLTVPILYYYQRRFVKPTIQSMGRYLIKLGFCLAPLFLYAGRFFFLAPMLMLGAVHVVFIQHVRVWKLPVVFLTLVAAAMLFTAFRETGTLNIFDANATRIIWADIFPEMRSFATVIYYAGQPDVADLIILNIVVSWVPSVVFIFLGADKTEYLFSIGRYVVESISPDLGIQAMGIRTGLVGEAYLAGGLLGVVVFFFLFGLLLGYLDRKFDRYTSEDARKLITVLFAVLLSLLVPYGGTLIVTLGYMAAFLVVTLWYAAPRVKQAQIYVSHVEEH